MLSPSGATAHPRAPTRAHLTCEHSLGRREHLLQALGGHPPQSDPGILTGCRERRLITAGPDSQAPPASIQDSGPSLELGTQPPHPQPGGGGQRGPRQDQSRLSHSAAWAALCQVGGRASAAVGSVPTPRPVSNRQGCRASSMPGPPTVCILGGPSSLPQPPRALSPKCQL